MQTLKINTLYSKASQKRQFFSVSFAEKTVFQRILRDFDNRTAGFSRPARGVYAADVCCGAAMFCCFKQPARAASMVSRWL